MKLNEYLKKYKIKTIDFARQIECQQSYVSLLTKGKRRPSPELALRIQEATEGKVTILELLFPDHPDAILSQIASSQSQKEV